MGGTAIYARESHDKAGDGHNVGDQVKTAQAFAVARTGGEVPASYVFTDNDILAFTGVRRPAYEALISAITRGEVSTVIVFQTSRLWRNRVERAKGIEIMKTHNVAVLAARGPSLDMSTAYGRGMAGLLGEFDSMESEVKSERQRHANQHRASEGKRWRGSVRPFGWSADDYTVPEPEEADAIRAAARMILAGGSVSGVVREWTAMGVKPAQGKKWTRQSVRAILLNPANAGLRRYHGEVVSAGEWEPIIPEETWRAVVAVLTDSSRQVPRGATSMLGGIAVCRCGNIVGHTFSSKGHAVYGCVHASKIDDGLPHVRVRSDLVDTYVSDAVVSKLSQPDAVSLFATEHPEVDLTSLRDQAAAIRRNLADLAADMTVGVISRAQMIAANERGQARLREIETTLTEAAKTHVAADLVGADDIAARWAALDISRRRAVISAIMSVQLNPVGRGARFPDPAKAFVIKWVS